MGCLNPVIKKVFFTGLVLVLLLPLLVPLPAQAGPKTDAWNKYPIPQKGEAGDWVLTGGGTGVTAICVAFDGTVYAATEELDGSPLNGYNLFKSTDDGYTWMPLWKIPPRDNPNGDAKVIALILPDREDADTLYLATRYNIYKSTDGGEHFVSLGSPPIISGTTTDNSALITSFDVTDYDGTHLIVVGAQDADDDDYGGAYFQDESKPFTGWADLRVGNAPAGTKYDVLAVAFSPNFDDDRQVVAVVTDEIDTIVTTKVGVSNWGGTVGDAYLLDLTSDPPDSLAATGASLAFPADYDSDVYEGEYTQFVGINDGGVNGGIYIVKGAETPDDSIAVPVFAPAPVHSLDAAGNAAGVVIVAGETFGLNIVAGLTNGNVINFATGVAYTPPSAPPAENAYVALGELHGSDYAVYAGTSGINGGFARSVDSGATFARTAFICDDLITITDLALSPIYSKDDTMYMITEGNSGNQILWRTTDCGKTWDAVLTEGQQIISIEGDTETIGTFDKVALSPRFSSDTTIFMCESEAGTIWRSTDNGFRFSPLPRKTGSTGTIDSWAVVGLKKVLVGDSLGNFYKTKNGGLTWSQETTGLSGFSDMVLSPDYDNDRTILAGNDGQVFRSTDDGDNWKEITEDGFGGKDGEEVFVAFHPGYADNGIFFAAGDDNNNNLVIDRYDNGWETIFEGTAADTGNATGLVVSPDGTLYCTFFDDSDGMFRSLNPLEDDVDDIEFEQVTEEISVALRALYLTAGSNVLWGFEDDDIYRYEDTLTVSVVLSVPSDGASTGRVDSAELRWDKLDGADMYQIEVDTNSAFGSADSDDTSLTSVRVTELEDGRTYYWRVRVAEGEPVLSRWSEVWSFTTSLSAAEWNPFVGGVPEAPPSGATSVPTIPAFAWNPADWATGYELVVARDSGFTDVVIAKVGDNALPTTAWVCDKDLDYNTTYYWKVRAISPTSYSQWAVGIFTTEPELPTPAPPPLPPSPPAPPIPGTPVYIWVMLAIVVVLIIALLVLIITTRRPY